MIQIILGNLSRFVHIGVDILPLIVLYIDVNAAQGVDGLDQGHKIYADIILDIQIQVGVQHFHSLLGSAVLVGRVTFAVGVVRPVQIGIAVYGHKLDLFGLVVDAGDDHGVASIACAQLADLTGINTKQGNIRIALQELGCILVHIFIDDHVADILTLELVKLP